MTASKPAAQLLVARQGAEAPQSGSRVQIAARHSVEAAQGGPAMSLNNNGPQAFSGGNVAFPLTAAMGTTAQLIKSGGGRFCRLHNPQSGAATITVYDAGDQSATTIAASNII